MSFKIGDKVKIGKIRTGFQMFEGPFTGCIGVITKQVQEEPCPAYYLTVDQEEDLMFFENELSKWEV
jgi:hypothetical protein